MKTGDAERVDWYLSKDQSTVYRFEPEDYILLLADLDDSLKFKRGNNWLGLAEGDVNYNKTVVKCANSDYSVLIPIFSDGYSLYPDKIR